MHKPTENLSLHSYLRQCYGSSTQKLVREYEKILHKKAQYENHHIFNLRCCDEGLVPMSLKVKPLVKTREFKATGSWIGQVKLFVCLYS